MTSNVFARIAALFVSAVMGFGAFDSAGAEQAATPKEIERRTELGYDEFEKKYMFGNKPVVVSGAFRSWRALSRWTPEFFKSEFGNMNFTLDDDLKRKAGYAAVPDSVQHRMSEFIDQGLGFDRSESRAVFSEPSPLR